MSFFMKISDPAIGANLYDPLNTNKHRVQVAQRYGPLHAAEN
jgi:hypothetical protein